VTAPPVLRVGIVGARRGGGHHAAIAASGGRMALAGVYDPAAAVAADFAAHHGGAIFRDFEEAVERCDLLVLASPQHYHAPQAAMALSAGVHVLSEVPAAVSLEQVSQLLAAARTSSAAYMIAENYCYLRQNLVIAAMAKAGVFGELYFGEAEYLHEMKAYHRGADGAPTWRTFWQVGKNAVTYPTHSLGPLLQWMEDRIVAVSAIGTGRWTSPVNEMEDTVTLSARTRKGGLIRMRLDLLSNRPEVWNYYSIQGTQGAYESGRGFGDRERVYVEGRAARDEWQPLDAFVKDFLPARYAAAPKGSGHWGSDAFPLLDFVDAIDRGERPPLDVYRALDMTLPGLVSEQSVALSGAWTAVPDPRTMTAGIGVDPGREAPLT
jgi:predicted dehydrogenase